MGWTFTHREKGQSHLEWFSKESNWEKGRVLDAAQVGQTVYLAFELGEEGAEDNEVIGVVCLTKWGRGHYNFGYKSMDESMGPYENQCPDKILDLLTETDNETAQTWRARCRWFNEILAHATEGSTILLEEPFNYGRVGLIHRMEVQKRFGRSMRVYAKGYRLKVPNRWPYQCKAIISRDQERWEPGPEPSYEENGA